MKPTWKACGLKTAGMLEIVLSCLFTEPNATYSRVAQCKAEMEALRTENNRYFYHCTSAFIHSS